MCDSLAQTSFVSLKPCVGASCSLPIPRCGFVCSGHTGEYRGRGKQKDRGDMFCISPLPWPFAPPWLLGEGQLQPSSIGNI